MDEVFTIYGHDTQHKGYWSEYDIDTNEYSNVPVEFWFAYVLNAEVSETIQPMLGMFTQSTGNEIYVDGHLEINFKEHDGIMIDGGKNMIVKIKTPRTNRKGIQTFDFMPATMVRRFLVLS